MSNVKKIPVILDTDIGGDIDDTWALAMMLNCPELDVKLVVSDTGDTEYRAKICAKLLERAGRSDIPVGVGIRFPSDGPREAQALWVQDYDLSRYPGVVHPDGVRAIINTINAGPEPVTLIAIGPVPNIAEALRREPGIAAKTRFVGMHGSIRKNLFGKDGAIAEYNVEQDIPACQKVFAAPWQSMTITPLDTCGIVQLQGELYARLRRNATALVQDVLENYHIWNEHHQRPFEADKTSSILFDTVAVHLAYSTQFLMMEPMRLRVDDKGFTVPDPQGQVINVALAWQDLEGYYAELVRRLLYSA